LNHAAIDSGIPRESATQRLGITGSVEIPVRGEIKHLKQNSGAPAPQELVTCETIWPSPVNDFNDLAGVGDYGMEPLRVAARGRKYPYLLGFWALTTCSYGCPCRLSYWFCMQIR